MKAKGFSGVSIAVIVAILAVLGVIAFCQYTKLQSITKSDGQERNFVALGSSITKANNLSSKLTGDHPEYSFATGTKINSLFSFLKGQGENLTAVNLAESGADSDDVLHKQVPNAVSYHPKYVTIDMTTDILKDVTPINLERNLTEIVKMFESDDAIILIGSYPNIPLLRSASYPACIEDKLRVGFDKLTSEEIRTFNQMISDFASENNLIFVDLYSVLSPSDVSDYDCVHPNIEGQEKLAEAWIEALEKGGENK